MVNETAKLATSTQTGGKYRGVADETAELATSEWRKIQRGGRRDSRTRHVRLEESTEGWQTRQQNSPRQTGGKCRGVADETAKLATSDWRKVQRGGR